MFVSSELSILIDISVSKWFVISCKISVPADFLKESSIVIWVVSLDLTVVVLRFFVTLDLFSVVVVPLKCFVSVDDLVDGLVLLIFLK